jgi:hypothetical protein
VVISTGRKFSILEPDEAGSRCLAPAGLRPGDRVVWEADPGAPAAGTMRQAFDVAPE